MVSLVLAIRLLVAAGMAVSSFRTKSWFKLTVDGEYGEESLGM